MLYLHVRHSTYSTHRVVYESKRKNINLFKVSVQFTIVTKTEISETQIRIMHHVYVHVSVMCVKIIVKAGHLKLCIC